MTSRVSQKVAVSVVYVAAMFMTIMDSTIVNVALPTIGRSFGVASTSVASVSIYFLVSLAVFMSASGWLGDRFGGKRVLLTAIVVFTVASVLCGMAGSLAELDVFRVLQGAGGGMMAPVGLAMLFRAFPPAERLRASSILTVPTTLAPALGPVIGGLLVTELSWRWVFYVNVPLGILAIAFGALFLQGGNALQPGPFDTAGFVLAGASLGLLMYGVSEGPIRHWSSGIVQAAIAAGAILLLVLVLVELRKRQPLIDLRLLGNRLFRSANGVMVLASASFIGTLYAVSLFFQDGRGLSALGAGLSTFPEALGVMAGGQLIQVAVTVEVTPKPPPRWSQPTPGEKMRLWQETQTTRHGSSPLPGRPLRPRWQSGGSRWRQRPLRRGASSIRPSAPRWRPDAPCLPGTGVPVVAHAARHTPMTGACATAAPS